MKYLHSLNPSQRAAVEAGEGPLLILAGAGSGKTRVLTCRIAHLIHYHGVDPSQIFAVTFTNKAAAEMRYRVFQLLGRDLGHPHDLAGMWVSTFHSACVRILRSDIHHLNYANQFTIYDDADQLSVIKACLKELNLDDKMCPPKAVQARINRVKNDGYDAATYQPSYGGPFEDAFARVFERYSEVLKLSSAVDFADLILLTVKLLAQFPRIREAYQRRFTHILIDEYQDTNRCQYLMMKHLAGERANLCAVGDEDQSIYKWRGADINNILNFEKDYPSARIFKLEQNYRSTQNIIEAASYVIAHNIERREKRLWTENEAGEKISVQECYDEHDEAQKVLSRISSALSEGETLNEMAVFYRTNAQSRVLEDLLRAKGLNYQIYGGLKFYERLEVKDALAYLKLIANPQDDVSFRRVVNVPARAIGQTTVEKLARRAREMGGSHYQLLEAAFGASPTLPATDFGRAARPLEKFFFLIESFRAAAKSLLPSDLLSLVLEETGYRKSLIDEATVESQSRLENLAELRQSIVEFELRSGAERPDVPITLEGFLQEIALVSDLDRFDPQAPAVKLMTIHMAKGLEFDRVFIVGLEEELFPNIRPWEAEDPADLEEERRLFYVGMTRARKHLTLLYAKNRTVFGNTHFRVMSRFLEEVPPQYLDYQKADFFSRRPRTVDRPALPEPAFSDEDFSQVYSDDLRDESFLDPDAPQTGSRVLHPVFGEGIVRGHVGGDKIMVEFRGRGVKKISLKFTQLKPV